MLTETFAALKGRIRVNISSDLRKGYITKDQEKDLLDKVLRKLPEFFEHHGIWNLKAGETWISPFGHRITGNVFEQLFGDAQDANHNLLTLSLDRIDDSKPHFDPMAEDVAGFFANVKPEPRAHNTAYKAQHESDIDTVKDFREKILALTALHRQTKKIGRLLYMLSTT
jgi:predicted helicase